MAEPNNKIIMLGKGVKMTRIAVIVICLASLKLRLSASIKISTKATHIAVGLAVSVKPKKLLRLLKNILKIIE